MHASDSSKIFSNLFELVQQLKINPNDVSGEFVHNATKWSTSRMTHLNRLKKSLGLISTLSGSIGLRPLQNTLYQLFASFLLGWCFTSKVSHKQLVELIIRVLRTLINSFSELRDAYSVN